MGPESHNAVDVAGRPALGRIDLAIAVAGLALLAAVAVPWQRDVTADTRRTETLALATSLRSAARFGHELWRARGGASVSARRGPVAIVNGYPAAADLPLLLEESEAMAFEGRDGAWRHRGLAPGERCGVRYAPPPRGGSQPAIELELDDC